MSNDMKHDADMKDVTSQQGNIVTMTKKKKKKSKDELWNDMFERLKRYKRKHGDCLVPPKYQEDPSLGCWVNQQRTRFKCGTIRKDRKASLQKLGFDWIKDDRCKWKADRDKSRIDFQWEKMYQELVNFREQNGHCMVPLSQKECDYKVLAQWVRTQRVGFLEGWIRDDRKTLLDKVGFVWRIDPSDASSSRFQRQWDEMFENLVKYKEVHGNCKVPQGHTDTVLATWVITQRVTRRSMDSCRVKRLNSIGFCWKAPRGGPAHKNHNGREQVDDQDFDSEYSDDDAEYSSHCESGGEGFDGQDNSREISHAAQRFDESVALVAKAVLVSPGDPPKYPVGTNVKKYFEGHGWFAGKAVSYDGEYYQVLYEDGDQEEYNDEEMEDIVLTSDLANVEVGSRVAVYLPDDDQYFEATITRERNKKRSLYLEYDNGDSEWIDLRQNEFRLLPGGTRRRWNEDEILDDVDEDEILDDVESDDDVGSDAPTDPDLDDDNDENESGLDIASELETSTLRLFEDNSREISDGAQRAIESVALVAEAAVASPGNPSKHPVGTNVKKYFEGHGWFAGKVISYDGEYYQVLYEDGDQEEYNDGEMKDIVLTSDLANVEVGSRVAVYWPGDDQYYEATVTRERNKKRPFYLEYDDGDREWIDLRQHMFGLLPGGTRRRKGEDEIVYCKKPDDDLESEAPADPDPVDNNNDANESEPDIVSELETSTLHLAVGNKRRRIEQAECDACEESRLGLVSGLESNNQERTDIELMADPKNVEVGSRVAVYWHDDDQYYEATVTRKRDKKRPLYLEYDDGDREWIDLRQHNFRLLPGGTLHRIVDYETEDGAEHGADDDSKSNALSDQDVCDDHSGANESEPYIASELATSTLLLAEGNKRRRIHQAESDTCEETRGSVLPGSEGHGREMAEVDLTSDLANVEVGSRVAVYWPDDDQYYKATVTRERNKNRSFYLEYDDGHCEWIDFCQHRFRLLPGGTRRRKDEDEIVSDAESAAAEALVSLAEVTQEDLPKLWS